MAVEDKNVSEFIDDFLTHGFYDPRKAHEYYMRTRKLVGRAAKKTEGEVKKGAKKVAQVVDNLHTSTSEKNQANAKAARVKAIHEKLDRLDREADKLPEAKKKKAKTRIQKIRDKLPKIHNPFGVKTESTTTEVVNYTRVKR